MQTGGKRGAEAGATDAQGSSFASSPGRYLTIATGEVDLDTGTIHTDGGSVSLSTTERALLDYMVENRSRVVPRSELLEKVWNYSPDLNTRAVDYTVKRLRAKIESEASSPAQLLTVRGVGYRFEPWIAQQAPESGASPTGSTTHDIPAQVDSFVGRDGDMRQISASFERARIVSLVGAGGAGKTRLAQEYARAMLGDGTVCGVRFCDLSVVSDLNGLATAVARSLGVRLTECASVQQCIDRVGVGLRGWGKTLLILDNFEHLLPFGRDPVTQWLRDAPEARVLVTTRERLGIRGEAVAPLASLAAVDASQLFCDRARAAGCPWPLGDRDRDALPTLVDALDRLPLALELAASRTVLFSVSQTLDRLTERFRLLKHETEDGTRRQSTLEATIDWSWALLSEPERDALVQCSVFRGGFSLDAVEQIVVLEPSAPPAIFVVEALVEKSLVRASVPSANAEVRFDLLVSIREYAAKKRQNGAELTKRHLRYYSRYGRPDVHRRLSARGGRDWRQLVLDQPNIEAAFEASLSAGEAQHTIALATARAVVHVHMGPLDDAAAVANIALAAYPDRIETLDLRILLVNMMQRGKNLDLAEAAAEPLVKEAEEAQLDERQMNLAFVQCMTAHNRGHYDSALRHIERGLELASPDSAWMPRLLTGRGFCLSAMGRIAASEECLERALALHQERGERRHVADVLGTLGCSAIYQGRWEDAEKHLNEAIEITSSDDDGGSRGIHLANLGLVHNKLHSREKALQTFDVALTLARQTGLQRSEIMLLGFQAQLCDDDERAIELLEKAVAVSVSSGSAQLHGMTLGKLAEQRASMGQLEEARELLDQAVSLLRETADPVQLCHALCRRGQLALQQERRADAAEDADEARRWMAEMELPPESGTGKAVAALVAGLQA